MQKIQTMIKITFNYKIKKKKNEKLNFFLFIKRIHTI